MEGGPARELPPATGGIRSLALSPDGRFLAAGSDGDRIALRDLRDGRGRELPGHVTWTRGLAFAPDSRRLLAGYSGNFLQWIDLDPGEGGPHWRGHANYVSDVTIRPGGAVAMSSSGDGTIRCWDAATGREIAQLPPHRDEVLSMAVGFDAVASGQIDGTVRIMRRRWTHDRQGDVSSPEQVLELVLDADGATREVALDHGVARLPLEAGEVRRFPLPDPGPNVRAARPRSAAAGYLVAHLMGTATEPVHILEHVVPYGTAFRRDEVVPEVAGGSIEGVAEHEGATCILYQGPGGRLRLARKGAAGWDDRDFGAVGTAKFAVDLVSRAGRLEIVTVAGQPPAIVSRVVGDGSDLPLPATGEDPVPPTSVRAWSDAGGTLHAVAWWETGRGPVILSGEGEASRVRQFTLEGETVQRAIGWSTPDGGLEIRWMTRPRGALRSASLTSRR